MRTLILMAALAGVWVVADPFDPGMWLFAAPLAIAILAFADSTRAGVAAPFGSMAAAMAVQMLIEYANGAPNTAAVSMGRIAFLLYVPAIALAGHIALRIRLRYNRGPASNATAV